MTESGVSVYSTNFVSMAAKLSDLVDETFRANLQTEGHADMPAKMQRTYESQKHQIVLPPTCCLGPQPEGHCPATLIQDIV